MHFATSLRATGLFAALAMATNITIVDKGDTGCVFQVGFKDDPLYGCYGDTQIISCDCKPSNLRLSRFILTRILPPIAMNSLESWPVCGEAAESTVTVKGENIVVFEDKSLDKSACCLMLSWAAGESCVVEDGASSCS